MRRALLEDLEPELVLAERVAVLQAAGHRRSEIARMLPNVTAPALRVAEARVKKAAGRLDHGDHDHHAS